MARQHIRTKNELLFNVTFKESIRTLKTIDVIPIIPEKTHEKCYSSYVFVFFFIQSYTNGKSNDSIRRNPQETRKLFGHPRIK